MKKVKLQDNRVGGLDLIAALDAHNDVRIGTGDSKSSLDFWQQMQEQCETAIATMQERMQGEEMPYKEWSDPNNLPQSALAWVTNHFYKDGIDSGPWSYDGRWVGAYYKGDDAETAEDWIIVTDNGGAFKVGAEYMVWFKRSDAGDETDPEFIYVAQAIWSEQALNNTLLSLRTGGPRVDDPDYET